MTLKNRPESLILAEENWERFAQEDPLWAILVDPTKTQGRWDPQEFLATGRQEIRVVFDHLQALGFSPNLNGTALDFGCGAGRLTQALGGRFRKAIGVDVSPTMIKIARDMARPLPQCEFVLNSAADLAQFPDGSMDFIYSSIVLQHLRPELSTAYIAEFMRLLAPQGVCVFQTCDGLRDLRAKLAIRTRLRRLSQRIRGQLPGVPTGPVMEMNPLSEAEVRTLLLAHFGRLLDVQLTNSGRANFNGQLQYLKFRDLRGYVSKQYCVTR